MEGEPKFEAFQYRFTFFYGDDKKPVTDHPFVAANVEGAYNDYVDECVKSGKKPIPLEEMVINQMGN